MRENESQKEIERSKLNAFSEQKNPLIILNIETNSTMNEPPKVVLGKSLDLNKFIEKD